MYVVKLPSGRWRATFRAGGRGSTRHSATFDYEYEAEAWAEAGERRARRAARGDTPPAEIPTPAPALEVAAEPVRRSSPAESTLTVAQHGRDMINRRAGRLTDGTVRGYRTHLTGLILSGIGDRPLGDLRRSDVERWITTQVEDNTGRATINARLKLLRMITRDARAELVVSSDAGAGVADLATDIPEKRSITETDEAKLLLACPAPLDVAVMIALDAGLRWSEVYGLDVASIVQGDYIHVRQVVERTTRKIRHYPKSHRARTVPLGTDRLAKALGPVVREARERGGPGALLFPSFTGGPMSYESWRRLRWTPAASASGLVPLLGFHELRHTYGSRLAAAGVPRSEIAELMGHADESTTRGYIHTGDDGARLTLVRAALDARRPAKGKRKARA
jgi:integrase